MVIKLVYLEMRNGYFANNLIVYKDSFIMDSKLNNIINLQ